MALASDLPCASCYRAGVHGQTPGDHPRPALFVEQLHRSHHASDHLWFGPCLISESTRTTPTASSQWRPTATNLGAPVNFILPRTLARESIERVSRHVPQRRIPFLSMRLPLSPCLSTAGSTIDSERVGKSGRECAWAGAAFTRAARRVRGAKTCPRCPAKVGVAPPSCLSPRPTREAFQLGDHNPSLSTPLCERLGSSLWQEPASYGMRYAVDCGDDGDPQGCHCHLLSHPTSQAALIRERSPELSA